MKHYPEEAARWPDQARELRKELARKIAFFVGLAENRATGIPGLTLHRRTAPTAPCSATYEPGVTVMAQGRKRVDLGRTTFFYGESRYLLTAVESFGDPKGHASGGLPRQGIRATGRQRRLLGCGRTSSQQTACRQRG